MESRDNLIAFCKEHKIKGYSGKKKNEIKELIKLFNTNINANTDTNTIIFQTMDSIKRLNYIGSKYQLIDWISTIISEKIGCLKDKCIGDLFSGTGIVSYHMRQNGVKLVSNDTELYSSIITYAFARSKYTLKCKEFIEELCKDLADDLHILFCGYITTHYIPYTEERKFFTVDNARRIDYVRNKLEINKKNMDEDEYKFILASIIISADSVSNVTAVYGAYLKKFKVKADKKMIITPIHMLTTDSLSTILNENVLSETILNISMDAVYLDPPYNERQYSKNYFPLNIIAKTPEQLLNEPTLKGKTGIPTDCFVSSFCKKGEVEKSFNTLFKHLKTKWLFLSYNSEALISKEKMIEIMSKYGEVSVEETDYKRFKSNKSNYKPINEYLFSLKFKFKY